VTASLVSIFGPLKGSTFSLSESEVSIGRDASNSISVVDPLLSRRHCTIRKEGNEFKIHDLNSRNGIFVNNIPTSGTVLQHGDEIELGDSLFLFLSKDQPATSIQAQLDHDLVGTFTRQVTAEDALYVKPERLTKLGYSTRAIRDLGVLLKISSVINSIQQLETLQQKLLQLSFEVIPAERAAILLCLENPEEFSPAFAVDSNFNRISNFQISREIVLRALNERTGILWNDVTTPENQNPLKSSAALCVPLIEFDTVLGILYYDTADRNILFDEFHLQLAWGIAATAAVSLKNAIDRNQLIEENERLKSGTELNMVGETPAICKIHELVAKAAPKISTVLICGESGTGKELVAKAIHRNSPRSSMPFVAINCASLAEALLESELFGHEKGAFTGAIAQKKGNLEIADRGTVFLDEVSEIPIGIQAKLLRVIQEREFQRVGGTRTIRIDVRFIAATNRNLEQAIRMGKFRQDLYYRLNVIRIDIPPLRERHDDIPLLAKYFVSKYSKTLQRRVKGISPEALECLLEYDWPGNVRELENLIERAVVLGSNELILLEDLPESLVENSPKISEGFIHSVKEEKKKIVQRALRQAGGNYLEASKLLNIHPNYLYRLLRTLGLKTD